MNININKLFNKYKNQPIWVAGSDPTLEDYPDDFFNNKLSLTLHLAYLKFPNATFRYFSERDRWMFLKEKYPEIKNKTNIFGYPFYNRTTEVSDEAVKDAKDTYFFKLVPYPPNGNSNDIFNPSGSNAMRTMVKEVIDGKRIEFGGHGTCLHECMYAIILMGFNPINIIGCNFKNIDGKEHFGEAHQIDHDMRPHTPSYTGYRGTRMTIGLNAIIEGCKNNGIVVNRIANYGKQILHIYQESEQAKLPKAMSGFTTL
jgi:hypothetical protein